MRLKQNDPTPNKHLRCVQCNWAWIPRLKGERLPVACPDCLSRKWNNGERSE